MRLFRKTMIFGGVALGILLLWLLAEIFLAPIIIKRQYKREINLDVLARRDESEHLGCSQMNYFCLPLALVARYRISGESSQIGSADSTRDRVGDILERDGWKRSTYAPSYTEFYTKRGKSVSVFTYCEDTNITTSYLLDEECPTYVGINIHYYNYLWFIDLLVGKF